MKKPQKPNTKSKKKLKGPKKTPQTKTSQSQKTTTSLPTPINVTTSADAPAALSLEDRAERSLVFLYKNRFTLLALTAPVLLLLLGFWGWNIWNDANRDARLNALANIDKQFQENTQAYEALLTQIEEIKKPNTQNTSDPEATQNTDLEEQKTSKKQEIAAMAAIYEEFFATYASHTEGHTAAIRAAQIHISENQPKAAADILGKLYKRNPRGRFFEYGVFLMYAGVLEDIKEYKQALEVVDYMLSTAYVKELGQEADLLYTKARLGVFLQDEEILNKALEELLKDHKDSPQTRLALALKSVY